MPRVNSQPFQTVVPQGAETDLLATCSGTIKWIPQFLRGKNCWKIFSGEWSLETPNKMVCRNRPHVSTGENLAIIGSRRWRKFTFKIKFKILTESIKPPQGGAIVYFRFANTRNFYSVHCCLCKNRIELIKRVKGNWCTLQSAGANFETGRSYTITINTDHGHHSCHLNGLNVIRAKDTDILKGCLGIGAKYCDVEFDQVSVTLPPSKM
jgi:hypothetical protein